MNEPTYKGYFAHIVYDSPVRIFFGHICGDNPAVRFATDDYDDLLPVFHKAVDNYLDFCAKNGIKPRKPVAPS